MARRLARAIGSSARRYAGGGLALFRNGYLAPAERAEAPH
jgi:hypothetical protein